MFYKLLCFLKLHSFVPINIYDYRSRICIHCKQKQILEFYSNRTHEWISIS